MATKTRKKMDAAELRAEVAKLGREITKLQEASADPKIRAAAAAKKARAAAKAELDARMGLSGASGHGRVEATPTKLVLGASPRKGR